jgi:hypothetical protein
MALNVQALTQTIISKYRSKLRQAFPDEAKGGTVDMIPKEDGSMDYKTTTYRGPVELDERTFRPLAEAVAEAVIEHLKSSGEVPDTDPGAGGTWRIT